MVTFTEEIINGKLHFLYSVRENSGDVCDMAKQVTFQPLLQRRSRNNNFVIVTIFIYFWSLSTDALPGPLQISMIESFATIVNS